MRRNCGEAIAMALTPRAMIRNCDTYRRCRLDPDDAHAQTLTSPRSPPITRAAIHFPLTAFTGDEAADHRRGFEALREREGGRVSAKTNTRTHLLLAWVDAIARHPRILDAVEDVIGPDILVWASGFFAKRPGDGTYLSWHQDATYWGLSTNDVGDRLGGADPSTPETGCMRVVPGTHKMQVAHVDTFAKGNLLSRGQEIAVAVDEKDAVDIVLAPGQFSLHHVLIFHGSGPNRGSDDRIGLAIRYVPTHLQQRSPIKDSALQVRGVDRFGHFAPDRPPEADFHPDAVAAHAESMARLMAITRDPRM